MGEWTQTTISGIGRIVTGKTPTSARPDYFGGDVPFVTPTDFDGRRIIDCTKRYLTKSGVDSLGNCLLPEGSVMVSCIGSDMGKSAIAAHRCVTNQQINSVIVDGPNDPLFLYYNLSGRRNEIRYAASGSAQPILNKSDFGRFDIDLPPPDEQRTIAGILGTLDDKIELSRRMNETLEEMARTLFKSWFVDFDPVQVKSEGRDSGLPSAIAALFPDSFEESEVGEIPRGWRVGTISEMADVVGGSTPSTDNEMFWASGHHYWATPKDLSSLSVPVLLKTERQITDAGLAQVGSGLLPKDTVLLSSRAPIGYLAIAEVPVAINQGFIAMKPRPGVSNLFLWLWTASAHDEIISRANGSTFLEISKSNFRPIPVVMPPIAVMKKFEAITRPLYDRIVAATRESDVLASIRDDLLPKLISGEIRISSASARSAR